MAISFGFFRVIWEEKIALGPSNATYNNGNVSNFTSLDSNDVAFDVENTTDLIFNSETAKSYYDSFTGERYERVLIYLAILVATLVVYILRTFGFYYMCLQISLHLHDLLFRAITRTSMLFFNTNPSGRILNRFSKDIRTLDVDVPRTLIDSASVSENVLTNSVWRSHDAVVK